MNDITNKMLNTSIPRLYLRYLLPTLLASLSTSLYCLVDVYFISKGSGSDGLAALSIAMPLFSIYAAIGLTIGVGGSTLMSIAQGNNDHKSRNQAFTLSMLLMIVIGTIITIAGCVDIEGFGYLLGSSPELIDHVIDYILPIHACALPFIIYYASAIILRNDHAPRLAMMATLFGNITNMILDYLFVMHFHLGIQGAAIATSLSTIISLVFASFHFILRKNTMHLDFDIFHLRLWKKIFVNGLGSGILEVCVAIVTLIFNYLILEVADALFLASFSIITNVAFVCRGLLNGFAQAVQPIISFNFGANRLDRTKNCYYLSLLYSCGFALVLYIIFLLIPQHVAAVFANGDQELIQISIGGIRLYFSSLIFSAYVTMTLNYFQSIEQGKLASILAFLKGFVFVVIAIPIMIYFFSKNGIYLIIPFAEMLGSVVALYLWKVVIRHDSSGGKNSSFHQT